MSIDRRLKTHELAMDTNRLHNRRCLGDVLDKRRRYVLGTLTKAGGVFAFATASTVGQFMPSMIELGIGFGGLIPLRPALQVEFFGMKAFGTIQGLLMVFITLGSIVSPLFAG